MKKPSKISHPLKNRTGTSQRTRHIEALQYDYALIDGKTLADRLNIISKCALQINFYEYVKNDIEGEYQELSNWLHFFKNSLPFQLAILSKVSTTDLDTQFTLLYNEIRKNPSKESLESLFDLILNKIVNPTIELFNVIEKSQNSFITPIRTILKSSFLEPLKIFVALHNASATFLCTRKKNFSSYLASPWQFSPKEIYKLYGAIQPVKKGKKEAFLIVAEELNTIFYQLLSGFITIVEDAPDFIEESLQPLQESLQKKHTPHLALLFTFLELFTHLQNNINDLGKEHLDFFYEKVLRITPKAAVPDRAHIVFEIAKHLNEYSLQKGLLLKNGKDDNKQDIQFELDHEIIIDKAQITNVRTLFLNKIQEEQYIEGVYIAPMANSMDGIGKAFKKGLPSNWSTLGDKFSKYVPEGNERPEEYPKARLGFVLASPVLFLQEGRRVINIILDCNIIADDPLFYEQKIKEIVTTLNAKNEKTIYALNNQVLDECSLSLTAQTYLKNLLIKQNPYLIEENELDAFLKIKDKISCLPIFNESDSRNLKNCFKNIESASAKHKNGLFNAWFSGEKEWIPRIPAVNILAQGDLPDYQRVGQIQFLVKIVLESEDPAIVFYNEKELKEPFDLEKPFPLIKIELNNDIIINCDNNSTTEVCCLKQKTSTNAEVSSYHFLKALKLVNSTINVDVCGVKNLIVQNDDNLQDVNKPIFPFGPRPRIDDSFIIGSKEVFCKNWQSFRIGVEWKDRPVDFVDYYEAYNQDDDIDIKDDSFKVEASVLDNADWKKENTPPANLKNIFISKEPFQPCSAINSEFNYNGYVWERTDFPISLYQSKSMPVEPLTPLTIASRKAFFRMRLKGEDFQHDSYAFVLAKQMMALANIIDAKSIERVRDDLRLLKLLSTRSISLTNSILGIVNFLVADVDRLQDDIEIPNLLSLVLSIQSDLNFIKNNYDSNANASKDRVDDALADIASIISEIGSVANSSSILGQIDHIKGHFDEIKDLIENNPGGNPNGISDDNVDNDLNAYGLQIILIDIERRIIRVTDILDVQSDAKIPNEPYTPEIKTIFVDYKAIATKDDIDIIHLYPFENTSKVEQIEQNPTLFPFHDDEGTLFIGIENITPGGNLSILFQLAEATANSEMDGAEVNWHYLSNNNWIALKPDFNVVSDTTDGLTVSGIVTIAVPDAISKIGNTVMPDNVYWIKASAYVSSMAVAETIGIHTQAVKASAKLSELNDTRRLNTGLEAGSIGKLVEGDFSIKKIEQLYPSFDGRQPEAEGHYYVRVSEHLKHKGRAQMLNDYEKIVLEGFPSIYKVKCISHTMGLSAITYKKDLELAPGFIIVTVIPDITKILSDNKLAPKAPVSLLEKIGDHLRKKTSPFARIKVMNARYEFVSVNIKVRLRRGKSQNFYQQKLKKDIINLLAPWFLGDSEKIAFGQSVLFSDVVGFVEQLEYVDFITNLELRGAENQSGSEIKPLTARSILTAGLICVTIDEEKCNGSDQLVIHNIQSVTINESSELS